MHVLAIDSGSYSIKFLSSWVDKKKIVHTKMHQVILHENMLKNPHWESTEVAAKEIISYIIDEHARQDTRIIMHVPHDLITTRFLTLPVKNRKKAEMMIPFQLEEDIPFPLADSHYAYHLETHKTQSLALVALTRQNDFTQFHQNTQSWSHSPSIVTSEASIMDCFFNHNPIAGPFCVLDMGHKTTKAYIFYNSKLINTHVSYVGGKNLDDMIAKTYGIPPEEAISYKHQNAFVLTQGQKSEVDENQREFANLMEQVLAPLMSDFHRWDLGFLVGHGVKISHVFLCGGTSNIKNITSFLTEKFKIKCSHLESFEDVDTAKINFSVEARASFTLSNMMTVSMRDKSHLINLFSGAYSMGGKSEFPIHTFSFLFVRASVVCLCLIISLIVHRVFLDMDIKAANAKIANISKNPILGLNAKERRLLGSQPQQVATSLQKKKKAITQQISTLQAASDIKALAPLVSISSTIAGTNAMMTSFSVQENGEVAASFQSDMPEELQTLKARLESSIFRNVSIQIDKTNNILNFSGFE
jgi:general secretion pathway protein L